MNMKCTELDYLFDAIKTLDEKDEFYNFFQDLCTIDELHEMGQIPESREPINMAPVDTSSQSSVSISFMALFIKTRMIRKLKYRDFLTKCPCILVLFE